MPAITLKPAAPAPLIKELLDLSKNLHEFLTTKFKSAEAAQGTKQEYLSLAQRLQFKGPMTPEEYLHLMKSLLAFLSKNKMVGESEQVECQMQLSASWAFYKCAVQVAEYNKIDTEDKAKSYAKQLADWVKPFRDKDKSSNNFYLAFLPMGNGRATLFTTPQGATFLVDCGSEEKGSFFSFVKDETDRQERFIQQAQLVRDLKVFLGETQSTLKGLILSNGSDKNWNALEEFFADIKRPFIEQVYMGGSRKDYTTTRLFKSFLLPKIKDDPQGMVQTKTCIREIYLSQYQKKYSTYGNSTAINFKEETEVQVGAIDKRGFLCIHQEENCQVFIVASNVANDKEYVKQWLELKKKDDLNKLDRGKAGRNSLVLLIEVHGKKILLTGDASQIVDAYLQREAVEVQKPKPSTPNTATSSSANSRMEEEEIIVLDPDQWGNLSIPPQVKADPDTDDGLSQEQLDAYTLAAGKQKTQNELALKALTGIHYVLAPDGGSKPTMLSEKLLNILKPQQIILASGLSLETAKAPDEAGYTHYVNVLKKLKIDEIDEHTIEYWKDGKLETKEKQKTPVSLTGYLPPLIIISPSPNA